MLDVPEVSDVPEDELEGDEEDDGFVEEDDGLVDDGDESLDDEELEALPGESVRELGSLRSRPLPLPLPLPFPLERSLLGSEIDPDAPVELRD